MGTNRRNRLKRGPTWLDTDGNLSDYVQCKNFDSAGGVDSSSQLSSPLPGQAVQHALCGFHHITNNPYPGPLLHTDKKENRRAVRHVTGTGSGLLGGIPRVVVQISALT